MHTKHPIELLGATHADIERHARLVEQLARHVPGRGGDAEARDAAASVLRFFETVGDAHHRHEEVDLFIAVERYVPSKELNATRALLHRMRRDHHEIALAWALIRPELEAIARGERAALTPEAARRFAQAHLDHMAREERELLPLARRVLGADVLARIGELMAARRRARQPAAQR